MYHEVFRVKCSEACAYVRGGLHIEACIYTRVAHGNCKRAVAIDHANNHVRFGAAKLVEVFAGKRVGKLVYTVSESAEEAPSFDVGAWARG
jgi:hypothetical protein